MLDKETKRTLKAQAHPLKPLVQIGKNGLTPAALANIDKALTDHALIKVKFNDHKTQKKELSTTIADETKADIVDLIGNTLILHRQT
jgi:RNA-binding protein